MPFAKDMYETWHKIEKSIMKFDRIFNKVEKFDARAMTDPLNHERREKRMLEGKRERWGNTHEGIEDIVEDKIFKFKYR